MRETLRQGKHETGLDFVVKFLLQFLKKMLCPLVHFTASETCGDYFITILIKQQRFNVYFFRLSLVQGTSEHRKK